MSSEQNKATVRKFYESVHAGKTAGLDEVCTADCVHHFPGMPGPLGNAAHKQMADGFVEAFPDATLTIDDIMADGDKVATRWTYRGTHKGAFQGMPATGKKFEIHGINYDRLSGGKIAEHWGAGDFLGMMQQLGAIPTPPQK